MTKIQNEFMKTKIDNQIRFLIDNKEKVSKIELDNDSTIVYFNGEDKWFGLSNYLGNTKLSRKIELRKVMLFYFFTYLISYFFSFI